MFFCFLFKCTKLQLSGYTNKISLSAKEEKLPELSQNSTRYNNRHVLVTSEWYLAKCNNQEMQLVNVRPTMLFPHLYWLFYLRHWGIIHFMAADIALWSLCYMLCCTKQQRVVLKLRHLFVSVVKSTAPGCLATAGVQKEYSLIIH